MLHKSLQSFLGEKPLLSQKRTRYLWEFLLDLEDSVAPVWPSCTSAQKTWELLNPGPRANASTNGGLIVQCYFLCHFCLVFFFSFFRTSCLKSLTIRSLRFVPPVNRRSRTASSPMHRVGLRIIPAPILLKCRNEQNKAEEEKKRFCVVNHIFAVISQLLTCPQDFLGYQCPDRSRQIDSEKTFLMSISCCPYSGLASDFHTRCIVARGLA